MFEIMVNGDSFVSTKQNANYYKSIGFEVKTLRSLDLGVDYEYLFGYFTPTEKGIYNSKVYTREEKRKLTVHWLRENEKLRVRKLREENDESE